MKNKRTKNKHISRKSMQHRFDYLLHNVLEELEHDNLNEYDFLDEKDTLENISLSEEYFY